MFFVLPGVVLKANAASVTDPGTGLIFNTSTATITGYKGSPTDLIVPQTISGIRVSNIGSSAFKNCASLIGVILPDNMSSIGTSAFQGCTNLTSISIGYGMSSINANAFDGCTKLANVSIFTSIQSIGNYAFQGCTSLTGITLPNSVTTIGTGAFKSCNKLVGIIIPTNVTGIAGSAFQYCTSLTSITIPSSVTSIGTLAFNGIVGLTIRGNAGSYAQTYATNNSITFSNISNNITVTLSKNGTNFVVNIKDYTVGHKYQIWSYQKITSDILLDKTSDISANQWILSRAYSLSTEADTVETDGSISFNIDSFISPDINYTIDVRTLDENNNYLGDNMDTYTPAEIHEVKINKVLIDGNSNNGQVSKEIKTSASISFSVISNDVAGTAYAATIMQDGRNIATAGAENKFSWNISTEKPGKYTVKITASNGTSADDKTITINLFTQTAPLYYGTIRAVNVSGANDGNKFNITINPTIASGQEFYYTIGEPGLAPFALSTVTTPGTSFVKSLDFDNYGIYNVFGYVKRTGINGYDDGFVRTVENKRSNNLSMKLTSNIDSAGTLSTINILKGEEVSFSAEATLGTLGQESIQYSYWRYDAKGFVLVKGWNSSNDFDWTPARVGEYTIQVRAKGPGSLSYEIAKSITVNVTDANEKIAQDVVITTNTAELSSNAISRTLLTIKANATASNGSDLLYKFYVSDDFLGTTQLQDYSSNQSCTWVPRKSGTYTISVLVKNRESFGKYDAIQSFTVIVKDKTAIIE